ncbi:hypothetical protein ABOD76_09400 [Deinococcus sonorensis KR-87]|uniref:Uncharacterized protein n=1 Tax=Deinococcus sonorensis KR-87 TaxID=694439 RepID=A0AAU7UDJ2_9DEIO
MSMTFQEASERVDRYISQFREGYFPPLLMLARLTEETGEVARRHRPHERQDAEAG